LDKIQVKTLVTSKQLANSDAKTATVEDKAKQAEILDLNVLNEVLNKSLDLTLRFKFSTFKNSLVNESFYFFFLFGRNEDYENDEYNDLESMSLNQLKML